MPTTSWPPRRSPRAVTIALCCGLVLAGCGLAGCGHDDRRLADDTSLAGPITAVHLDGDDGGAIVRGKVGTTTVSVHRDITYRDRPPGQTAALEGGVLTLRGCGEHCAVDYTVTVPPGLPVTGRTTNGAVELTDVGSVDVTTTSGSVGLDQVQGDVRARTTNGDVHGRDLRGGRTEVETSNGEIDLAPAVAQDVRAATDNGSITLGLPGGGYRIATQTVDGDREIAVASDPRAAHVVDLRTTNGSITVRGR